MNQRKAGAVLSYVGIAGNTVASFIFVPILISLLGKEQFGLYQLVGSMIAYLMIMDFGLANTTTRYYSIYMAQGNDKSKENLLATTGVLYCLISAAIVIAGICGIDYLISFYTNTLSPQDIAVAKKMFYILLVNVAIVIPANIFTAVINSHEKFIFSKTIIIFTAFFRPLTILLFLLISTNIITVVVVQTVFNILIVAANIYFALFILKAKFKLYFWDWKLVKEILRFSFFVFIPGIMNLAYWKTGQIILGAVSGANTVAVYATAILIANAYISLSGSISGVFLPRLSAITAKTDDMSEINNIFISSSRIQFLLLALFLSGFIVYGKEFMFFWLGESFISGYYLALIFMLGLFICLVQGVGGPIVQAKNKHAFRSVVYFLLGLANIAISIPMAKLYGALGCAITTGFCLLLGQTIIMNIYYHKIGIAIFKFFKEIFFSSFVVFGVSIAAIIIKYYWVCDNLYSFLSQIVIFTLMYSILMWKLFMNDYEKNLVLNPLFKALNKV